MRDPDLFILARVVHVLGVVLWIGGVAFVTTVLLPALRRTTDPARRLALFEELEGRFAFQARIVTVVTGLSGFGVNGVTGDYSRGASGLWIENGQLTHPVEEVTIAGNLLQMYRDVEMVGNDLVFRSSIVAPTLKIRQMMLAGR